MASQKAPAACLGALLGLPPTPCADQGEEDLESPGEAPQTPATPSTGPAIPWRCQPHFLSTYYASGKDLLSYWKY